MNQNRVQCSHGVQTREAVPSLGARMNQPPDMLNGWIIGGSLDSLTDGLEAEVEVLNKIGSPLPKDQSGDRIGPLGAVGIPAKVGRPISKKLSLLGVRIGPNGPQVPQKRSHGHHITAVQRSETVFHGRRMRERFDADRQSRMFLGTATTMMNHLVPLHLLMRT